MHNKQLRAKILKICIFLKRNIYQPVLLILFIKSKALSNAANELLRSRITYALNNQPAKRTIFQLPKV